ncbi:MAG: HNH endonuclease signature motif containing protein [Nitrosopumilus sp.]
MGKKTPPFPVYPTWTTAKFWSFIRSGLRAKFSRWPPKYAVYAAAKRDILVKKGNQRFEYQCALCDRWFGMKEVEVDHIIPCGSLRNYKDLGAFVKRLFCSQEHLRLLCKPCHKTRTKEER